MNEEDLLVRIGLTEKKFLASLARLDAGAKRTSNVMEKQFAKANRRFQRDTRRSNRAARSFANGGLRQMSMQLSQVAQQGAVTGNYLQALAIQAPDLALGFGAVGIAAGALVPILFSVAQSQFDLGDANEDTSEKLDAFTSALAQAQKMADLASTPIKDLRDRFGEFADEVQRGAEIAAQAALSQAMRDLSATSDVIAVALQETVSAAAGYQDALSALATAQDALGERTISNASSFEQFDASVAEARERMVEAADQIGLTSAQALELNDALGALASAEGMAGVAEAAATALDLLKDMFDVTENIPTEVADIVSNLQGVLEAAAAGTAAFDDMSDAADRTAAAAGRIATNAALAASALRGVVAERAVLAGVEAGAIPPEALADLPRPMAETFATEQAMTQRLADRRASQNGSTGRRRRSGGGGTSEAQRERNRMEQEAGRIYDETRTAAERYAIELERLNELQKAGALDADTFARAVAQLDGDYVSEGMRNLRGEVEGIADSLAQAIVNGDDLGQTLGNMFRQAAADFISSGLQRALLSLLGVTGGGGGLLGAAAPGAPLSAIPSFDGGGHTGPGVRAGGLDGFGGRLAIVHPNEVVSDLTRGQGGLSLSINVDNRAGGEVDATASLSGNQINVELIRAGRQIIAAGAWDRDLRDNFGIQRKGR